MSVIDDLIRIEPNGTLSFGNYLLEHKRKIQDFEVKGDLYKVKTSKELTRLEKNGKLLYESIPGTTVHQFEDNEKLIVFNVEGIEDSQITLELESGADYKLFLDSTNIGRVKTNLSGKCNLSVDLKDELVEVKLEKINE